MGYIQEVRKFTSVAQENLPERPILMDEKAVNFICTMVTDELDELKEAKTIVDQADALIDAIYYICDCAIRHGMNLDPLFDIVHGANMAKIVDGKVLRRADSKILKPEGWQKPEPLLEREMQRQEKEGSFKDT